MDADDLEPRKPVLAPLDLEKMSVEELKDYIAKMEQEITRVQTVISAKEAHRNSAEDVFKT
jgi:uncharacterized small protein (DUF1192 family)